MTRHSSGGFAEPLHGQAQKIRKTGVVVIGGGIVGVSTALFLARDRVPVVLCEKGEIGREQSGRNWGWCRTFGRDMREMELGLHSLRLWNAMNETIGGETSAGRIASVVTSQGRIACDAVVICAGAWSTRLCRRIGHRLPQLIVNESVSRTAPVSGGPDVTMRSREFAIRKRLDGGYTIGGGGTIRAELTPDSVRFLPDFMPILRAYGKMIRLHPTSHSWSQWRALFGASAPMPTLDPQPDLATTAKVHASLVRDFPIFADVAITARWAGSIDVTPDALPVISPLPVDGAFVATGFSGHGFGMGPGAGALAAALVKGQKPPVDPANFHVGRLLNTGELKLGPL